MSLRALIFDFDGTIAETERDGHRVAYNRAFADLGLDWHWDVRVYGELLAVAGGKERIAHFVATSQAPPPPGDLAALTERIHARKGERFAEIAPTLRLRCGVERLVREATDAGLAVAIATTAAESGVRAVLASAPATLAAFDVIAAGDVVAKKKPAPDIYRYALGALDVRAEEAVAFEDSQVGLAAALGAAIATVVTPSDYTQDERFDGARAVLTSLGESDRPATTLAGPSPPERFVTLAFLRTLLPEPA